VTSSSVLPTRFVIFDWDGTLLDSYAADTKAYLAMFAALGIQWTTRELDLNYHPDWYRVYRAARIKRERWSDADKIWREAYGRERPKLLPNARAVLRALSKRFTLGLVTSGDSSRVRLQLRNLKLDKVFRVCICAEDASRRKPHPAPLLRALSLLRANPSECVYVGDSPQDMEMARRAGVRAIGIFGPFPTEKGLRAAKPALLLDSISELPRHLGVAGVAEGEAISRKAAKKVPEPVLRAKQKRVARPKKRRSAA
jgi:HAD superfamily hydrolase (TIGR01509 family)